MDVFDCFIEVLQYFEPDKQNLEAEKVDDFIELPKANSVSF